MSEHENNISLNEELFARIKAVYKQQDKETLNRTATKYDYPLIDGREMTSAEKKKYRMEQDIITVGVWNP